MGGTATADLLPVFCYRLAVASLRLVWVSYLVQALAMFAMQLRENQFLYSLKYFFYSQTCFILMPRKCFLDIL